MVETPAGWNGSTMSGAWRLFHTKQSRRGGGETQSCKEGRKESAQEVKSQCKSPEVIEGKGARHEVRERGLLTRAMGNGCLIRSELGSLLRF